ncbi:MAG: rod shape-determining protein MreD [Syntrophomonadaceae bacterium]|nr:rod shape-determining protein MreD [Syntrophomonadaceae bacterium]
MRYLILALMPFLALFLQTTFFRMFSFQGAVPDAVLVLVIFYAIFNGANKGIIYGAACGLLEDLYFGRFIGMNAIIKGLTGFIIGRLQGNVFKENILVGVLGVIGGTALNAFLLFILSLVSFEVFNIDKSIFMNLIYQGVYNTLIGIPLYIWYYRSSTRGILRKAGKHT